MKKILLTFLLLPSIAFADETIYTWGYGDIMAHVLRSIKYVFAMNDYLVLMKIFVTIGLILVLLSYLGRNKDPLALIKHYVIAMSMYYLFISPTIKTNVYIDDLNNNNYDQVITDVPLLYAKVLSTFSIFEKTIANVFDTAFSLPDDLKYSQAGFMSAFGLMSNANSHKILDTYLYLSINDYINDCVFPDIVEGSKDVYALARSDDLWSELGGTSASRTTKYYDSTNPDGTIMTCPDAYNQITGKLSDYITNTGLPYLANFVGAYSSSQVSNALGVASDYFLNYAVSGQAYLKQAIAMNMFSEAFQNYAKVNAISGTGLALGAAKAEEIARNNLVLSGVLGAKYIPVIKGILTALIAAFFPLLILLMVTPMFSRVLTGFFLMLFWLSLWHLGDTFINAVVNVKASSFLQATANGSYNLLNKGVVDSSILDYINMVSSFYWAIPTISFIIATGFSIYAMNSLSNQLASKAQAPASVSGEMATGSMDISSKLSTGRQWNYSSFEGGGFSSSYAMNYTGNWGFTENIHQQRQGIIGNESINYDTSSIQRLNKELDKAIGYSGLNLGDGVIRNAIGKHEGNSYELQAGRIGDFQILKGSQFNVDEKGNITGTIVGRDINGNQWTLNFSQGELIKAEGLVDGKKVEWRHDTNEGADVVNFEIADGVKSSAKFTENSDYIASTSMPDKVSATEEFSKSLTSKLATLNKLSNTHSVQNVFREGTQEQKQTALNYAFKIATDDRYTGTEAQRYVQSKAYSALESTVKDLSAGGDNVITSGHKLDREDVSRLKAGGNIKISSDKIPVVNNILSKIGISLEGHGGIEKAWISKDSIYAETKDGSFFKFSLSDKAQNEFQRRFANELVTERSHSTSYSTSRDVSVSNKASTTRFRESFFQAVSQLAMEDAKVLENARTYTQKEGANINQDITRHIIDVVSDTTGKSWAEVQEEINQNPAVLREYLQNNEILSKVSERLTGKERGLSFIRETQSMADEVNKDVNIAGEELKTKGAKLQNMTIPKVSGRNYTEGDVINIAHQKGINISNVNKAFNSGLAQQTNGALAYGEHNVGLTNRVLNTKNKLKEKYGDDIKSGLDREEYRLNEDINKFNKQYGYNFTSEDIRTGKALTSMAKDVSNKLKGIDDKIKSYEQLKNNQAIWSQLPENTKKSLEIDYHNALKEKQNLLTALTDLSSLQQREQQLHQDRLTFNMLKQYESTMPKITYGEKIEKGGFLGYLINPNKEINYPPYKPSTQSPEYRFPDRNEED